MAKRQNAELGDILDAVESSSDLQLRELKNINKKLASSGLIITRTNSGSNTSSEPKQANMRSYNRNKKAIKNGDTKAIADAVSAGIKQAEKQQRQRGANGRFISTNPKEKAATRPPRQDKKGGSLWSQPPSKSSQAQANKKADANREAVEEQTKKTIERQEETNNLLRELLGLAKKKPKPTSNSNKSGGRGRSGNIIDDVIDNIGGGNGRNRNKKKRGVLGKLGGGIRKAMGTASLLTGAASAYRLFKGEGTTIDKLQVAEAGIHAGTEAVTSKTGQKVVGVVGKTLAKTSLGKMAETEGMKAVGKAVKFIPGVGTVLGAGIDAYQGFTDDDAIRQGFGLKDGDKITARQRTENGLASVLTLGGIVSGGSQLAGGALDMFGMHDAAKAVSFTTGDLAKGIDNMDNSVETAVADSWNSMKDWFKGDSKDTEQNADNRNDKLIAAIQMWGINNGNPNSPPTEFANDNPTQAAIRNSRNESAASNMLMDSRKAAVQGYVAKAAKETGVSEAEINAIINAESSYNSQANSGNDHLGLMQLSADAAREGGINPNARFDPEQNILAGARYYAKQKVAMGGNIPSALLAYNQGAGGARAMLSGRKAMNAEGSKYINNPKFAGIIGGQKPYSADSSYYAAGGKKGVVPVTTTGQSSPSGIDMWVDALTSGLDSNSEYAKELKKAYKNGLTGIESLYNGGDKAAAAFMGQHHIGTFGGAPSKSLDLPAGWQVGGPNIGDAVKRRTGELGQWFGGLVGNQQKGTLPGQPGHERANTPALADILRGSASDTFDWATQGISGGGIIDGLMGNLGMNPMVADIVKPLTDAAGSKLDSWLGTGRTAVSDFISGRPTTQKSVTDLASSGANATVSRDQAAVKSDDSLYGVMKRVADGLETLIGVTEDGNKIAKDNVGAGGKNEAKVSSQPGPSGDIPLFSTSKALMSMLEGIL